MLAQKDTSRVEEMNNLLQIVINHLTTTSNVYAPPKELVLILLSVQQIQSDWKRYLNLEKKPSTMKELLKSNSQLVMILMDYLSDSTALKDLLINIIPKKVSNIPKVNHVVTKVITNYNGNYLDYIKLGSDHVEQQVILDCIRETMKADRVKEEPSVDLKNDELDEIFRKLGYSKSSRYCLVRALLYFNWNINSSLQEQITKCFLESNNKAHVSITLFNKIRRELDFCSFELHREIEQDLSKGVETVSDILNMREDDFEKVKRIVVDTKKAKRKEFQDASKVLSGPKKSKKQPTIKHCKALSTVQVSTANNPIQQPSTPLKTEPKKSKKEIMKQPPVKEKILGTNLEDTEFLPCQQVENANTNPIQEQDTDVNNSIQAALTDLKFTNPNTNPIQVVIPATETAHEDDTTSSACSSDFFASKAVDVEEYKKMEYRNLLVENNKYVIEAMAENSVSINKFIIEAMAENNKSINKTIIEAIAENNKFIIEAMAENNKSINKSIIEAIAENNKSIIEAMAENTKELMKHISEVQKENKNN